LSTQANAMVNNTMRSLAVDPLMPLRLPERVIKRPSALAEH
jgi:hypothetical protein